MSQFSSSMVVADLDYIAPSQACIKPMLLKQQQQQESTTKKGTTSFGVQKYRPGEAPSPDEIIKISLQDCLACSGCVTTAETMLVTSQSRTEIEGVLQNSPDRVLFVSISDQSASSIAVQCGVGVDAAMQIISGFFHAVLNASFVVDLRWALKASVHETAREYVRRVQHEPHRLPLLVSACPGWVCYCEKTHPELLPLLCPVMSPQGIAGAFAKQALGPAVYHVSIQPCFDRKLEAVRDGIRRRSSSGDDSSAEAALLEKSTEAYTDCVLSSAELLEWMQSVDSAMPWAAALDCPPEAVRDVQPQHCEAVTVEGSGGYHQYAMQYAAAALNNSGDQLSLVPYEQLQYETRRNSNHRIVTCPQLPSVNFCIAYGFQHVQNIVRGLNRPTASTPKYSFIEIMACPEGCLNGGGQVRTQRYQETLVNVKSAFQSYAQSVTTSTSLQRQQSNDEGGCGELQSKARRLEAGGSSGGRPMTATSFTTQALYDVLANNSGGGADAMCTVFHDRKKEMEQQANIVHSLKW